MNALAAYLPTGRVWAAKNLAGTVTRGLLEGLSGELLRSTALVEEFRQEILPDETTLFVDEWERAVGIPDDCFTGEGTLEERRNDVLAKLASLGIQTAEDMRQLALLIYGIELTIRNPQRDENNIFPYTFNPTGESDPLNDGGDFVFGLSDREARFQIIIEYANLPTAVLFPYTFPIPFLTREVAIIECLFQKLRPANVGFTQDIPIPSESPSPTPESPGFDLQLNSIDFVGAGLGFRGFDAGSLGLGVTNTFSLGVWAKKEDTSISTHNMVFFGDNIGGTRNSCRIQSASLSDDDIEILIHDSSFVQKQSARWNGVLTDGLWHHYVVTWDGTAGGLQLFYDGSLLAPDTHTTDLAGTLVDTNARVISVGAAPVGGIAWQGPIYSATLYDEVLSASQATAMYNGGNGRDLNLSAVEGSISELPIHYYRIGLGSAMGDFQSDHGDGAPEPILLDDGQTFTSTDQTTDIPDGT